MHISKTGGNCRIFPNNEIKFQHMPELLHYICYHSLIKFLLKAAPRGPYPVTVSSSSGTLMDEGGELLFVRKNPFLQQRDNIFL